jgi:hypothetical protein
MIELRYLNTLHTIHALLKDSQINWVVTGSLGMALQGMDIEVHDIDIQTDKDGAYEMERLFFEYVVKPVHDSVSERIRSHFGALEIGGIKVEIMGDIQKRLDNQTWEEPVKVECHKHWVGIDGMQIPVLSLAYEYQAYLKLGRNEKAEMLRKWLQKSKAS